MPSGRIRLIRSSNYGEPVHLDQSYYTQLFICVVFLFCCHLIGGMIMKILIKVAIFQRDLRIETARLFY
jgi:hypothetical protein